jgi:hypothetical protein
LWITEAKFIVPDWGMKLTVAYRVVVRPVRLHRLAGRYDNPLCQSLLYLSPSKEHEFGYRLF